MYSQITRVFMIPTFATPVGLEWARGRLDSFTRLGEHIADITCVFRDSGALQFAVDAERINTSLIRQSRPTERESARRTGPAYSADESRFFTLIEEITSQTTAELRDPGKSPVFQDGWAMMTGANLLFLGGTSIPQFLGLDAKRALRSVLGRENSYVMPDDFVFEDHADDRLGAGVVTALRVYLGQEKLGSKRTDLVPHRLHQVDWKEFRDGGLQESHAFVIGAFSIDPR
jgi:hypothetical protein